MLQRDRVRTKAWFCGSLLWALSLLGQMRAQVGHSVVVERLSLSRGGSLFKLGTFQRQFLVTQPIRSDDYSSTEFWRHYCFAFRFLRRGQKVL